MLVRFLVLASFLFTAACGDDPTNPADVLAPELGKGDRSPDSVTFTMIADGNDGLDEPRDLAFNPRRPDELWIVNYSDDSTTIVFDASTEQRSAEHRVDGYALHFMAEVTALAFGADETTIGKPGTFASCGESMNTYNDTGPPNEFMGITLWSSDLSVFAEQNPNGLGSHLDMLHCSPLCMGIAHQQANVYWAFGGYHNNIVKYDFAIDDGIGNDDHSDGRAYWYVTDEVAYVPGVPSHLEYDADEKQLYIADSGNSRVTVLDTESGVEGGIIQPFEPMVEYRAIDGAVLTDLVPASTELVMLPSGIALRNEYVYVSDHANSRISAFKREDGERVNWIDTGLPEGSLGGITFGPDDKLYFVDMRGDRVLRIDP